MLPERHQWKPAVQATAIMLRTPPFDGQSPASQPRPLPIYAAQFWERPPSPASHPPAPRAEPAERSHYVVISRDGRKHITRVHVMLPNTTRAPIANPPNSAQLGGIPYHYPKLHPGPCSSVGMRRRTDTQTDRHAHRQTHRREWPQYILRRLRLTQNVITHTHIHIHYNTNTAAVIRLDSYLTTVMPTNAALPTVNFEPLEHWLTVNPGDIGTLTNVL